MTTTANKLHVIRRRFCDIPGSGSRSKAYAYCVYRGASYVARFGRRSDAEAFIVQEIRAANAREESGA